MALMFWLLIAEKDLTKSLWCESNIAIGRQINVPMHQCEREAIMDQDFTIFMDPPFDVVFLLRLDSAGTLFDRFVASGSEVFQLSMHYPPYQKKDVGA